MPHRRTLLLMAAAGALALALLLGRAAGAQTVPAAQTAPGLGVGPYSIDPRPDGATICWHTDGEEGGAALVRPEGSSGWTEIPEYGHTRFHTVRLGGLMGGTAYHVQVLTAPGGALRGTLEFRTAPVDPTDPAGFTFFVYGDTQGSLKAHPRVARAALAEARRLGPIAFLLHVGDFSDGGDELSMKRQFFDPGADLLAHVSLVSVRGNHDNEWPLWKSCFPAPAPTDYYPQTWDYCLDYGGARLVVLDGNAPGQTRDRRMNWLRDRLGEAPDRWRLVAIHQPLYSRGQHANEEYTAELRALLEPYLVAGKVHAVFSGHDHTYQRSLPVKGVTYFVAGGGGGSIERNPTLGPREWSARFESAQNFLVVHVEPTRLTVRAVAATQPDGDVFAQIDAVEIPRDGAWPAVDLAAIPRVSINLEGTGPPLHQILLIGGGALLAVALVLKIAQRRRGKAAGR